jgi:hypothetical protein
MSRDKTQGLDLDQSFKRPPLILSPAGKMRIVVASFGSRDELSSLLEKFRVPQPPTMILLEGAGELLHDWIGRQKGKLRGLRTEETTSAKDLPPNSFSFAEFDRGIEILTRDIRASSGIDVSLLVVGPLTPSTIKRLSTFNCNHMILEDRGDRNPPELVKKATELIPLTSFAYESDRYFSQVKAATKKVEE